jgi:alkanesulfonate monooxygenase SsuD/methylene tetrahydromethanopterin reductase-like flavin-dependent oxidoreductase (luciferase family)
MWRGDVSPFNGEYYQLDEPMNSPQPLSQPYPQILVAGEGGKVTLRLVSQYGDACNLHLGTPLPGYFEWYRQLYDRRREKMIHKFAVLRQHCENVGRFLQRNRENRA